MDAAAGNAADCGRSPISPTCSRRDAICSVRRRRRRSAAGSCPARAWAVTAGASAAISPSKATSRSPRTWCSTASRSGRNELPSQHLRSASSMPSSSPRRRDRSNAKWTRHTLVLEDRAMKLVFLPHVREGIAPTTSAARARRPSVGVRLESPGRQARDVSRPMPLLGPGDVVAIEPRQVLRVTPAAGTRDAEPEFFPVDRIRRARSAVDVQPDRSERHARPAVDGADRRRGDARRQPRTRPAGTEPVDPATAGGSGAAASCPI